MQNLTSKIATAILAVIGLLSTGMIAVCTSELGRYDRWLSPTVATVLLIVGFVFLAAGALATIILLLLAAINLSSKLDPRWPELVLRGRDRRSASGQANARSNMQSADDQKH